MRILHVISSLDPKDGGPPKIAACIASAQAAMGHDVHLLTESEAGREEYVRHLLDAVPGIDRVKLQQVPKNGEWRWLLDPEKKRIARDAVSQVDAVHLHNVWNPILIAAGKACRKLNKPYLILLNGMLDPWSLSQKALKKKLAIALVYKKLYNGAAALHLGNTHERELIKPLGLTARGEIIPNGVFEEDLHDLPAKGTFYKMHPELHDLPFILFMSRLHYKKGLDYLADAFAVFAESNNEAHLVVAGPEEGAGDAFKEQIANAGLTDRVHVIGPIHGEEKRAALVDATCFCLPSRQEGFSVAITEAIGHGVPAVITEGCHFPEVETEGAGRVLPLDAKRVGHALIEVMSDPGLRQQMSEKGRALALGRYTWPKVAQQTVGIYESALKQKR